MWACGRCTRRRHARMVQTRCSPTLRRWRLRSWRQERRKASCGRGSACRLGVKGGLKGCLFVIDGCQGGSLSVCVVLTNGCQRGSQRVRVFVSTNGCVFVDEWVSRGVSKSVCLSLNGCQGGSQRVCVNKWVLGGCVVLRWARSGWVVGGAAQTAPGECWARVGQCLHS